MIIGKAAAVTSFERVALAAVLALFLGLNTLTAVRYPIVWLDEVMFADPAASLSLGQGFRSTAWPVQGGDEFFAGYAPLYPLALAAWMRLTGLDPAGLRSLNYLLILLAAVAVWLAVARLGLVGTARHRLLLAALLLCGYGVSMGYRSGRPDPLMLFLVALLLLAYTVRRSRRRWALLIALSTLLPLAGLALLPFALMLATLLLLSLRRQFVMEFAAILGGLAMGASALLALYAWNGVLGSFRETAEVYGAGGLITVAASGSDFRHENRLPKDLSFALLLPAACLLLLSSRRRGGIRWRSPLGLGLACSFVIPAGMLLVGKFPTYYTWMVYVPLAVGVAASLSSTPSRASGRAMIHALLLLACLAGLPFQLAISLYDWEDRDHAPVQALVDRHVSRADTVYCDYGAYFAARQRTGSVFTPHALRTMTAGERTKVSVLILPPSHLDHVAASIGGAWVTVGAGLRPRKGTFFEDVLGVPIRFGNFNRKYELQVYRRRDGGG